MSHDFLCFMHAFFLPAAHSCRDSAWCPAADIYRTRRGWLLKVELAGVRSQDVTVTVRGRELLVRGVRRDWAVEEGQSHYRMEITYDEFERRFDLPWDLEHARFASDYRDGMLLVSIETEEAHP